MLSSYVALHLSACPPNRLSGRLPSAAIPCSLSGPRHSTLSPAHVPHLVQGDNCRFSHVLPSSGGADQHQAPRLLGLQRLSGGAPHQAAMAASQQPSAGGVLSFGAPGAAAFAGSGTAPGGSAAGSRAGTPDIRLGAGTGGAGASAGGSGGGGGGGGSSGFSVTAPAFSPSSREPASGSGSSAAAAAAAAAAAGGFPPSTASLPAFAGLGASLSLDGFGGGGGGGHFGGSRPGSAANSGESGSGGRAPGVAHASAGTAAATLCSLVSPARLPAHLPCPHELSIARAPLSLYPFAVLPLTHPPFPCLSFMRLPAAFATPRDDLRLSAETESFEDASETLAGGPGPPGGSQYHHQQRYQQAPQQQAGPLAGESYGEADGAEAYLDAYAEAAEEGEEEGEGGAFAASEEHSGAFGSSAAFRRPLRAHLPLGQRHQAYAGFGDGYSSGGAGKARGEFPGGSGAAAAAAAAAAAFDMGGQQDSYGLPSEASLFQDLPGFLKDTTDE